MDPLTIDPVRAMSQEEWRVFVAGHLAKINDRLDQLEQRRTVNLPNFVVAGGGLGIGSVATWLTLPFF